MSMYVDICVYMHIYADLPIDILRQVLFTETILHTIYSIMSILLYFKVIADSNSLSRFYDLLMRYNPQFKEH